MVYWGYGAWLYFKLELVGLPKEIVPPCFFNTEGKRNFVMAVSIRVLFFASAREAAGTASTTVELDDAADTTALR